MNQVESLMSSNVVFVLRGDTCLLAFDKTHHYFMVQYAFGSMDR